MKYLVLLSLIFYSQLSYAQQKPGNKNMERFNIPQFKSMEKDDEYVRKMSDGTVVDQMQTNEGFVETTVTPNSMFYGYKEYYPDGQLRLKGQLYRHGDFRSGLWIECEEDGTISRQIDYDKQFRLTVTDVLHILQENKIPIDLKKSSSQINRDAEEGKATWYVQYVEDPRLVNTLKVDDATGKIYDQSTLRHKARR